MSAEYHSFLICFHPGHTDVFRNGLPLGVVCDDVFKPHKHTMPDGREVFAGIPPGLTNAVLGVIGRMQVQESAAVPAEHQKSTKPEVTASPDNDAKDALIAQLRSQLDENPYRIGVITKLQEEVNEARAAIQRWAMLNAKLVTAGNRMASYLAPGPIQAQTPTESDFLLANWEQAASATPESTGKELAELREAVADVNRTASLLAHQNHGRWDPESEHQTRARNVVNNIIRITNAARQQQEGVK